MPVRRTTDLDERRLLRMPESGIGYQVIWAPSNEYFYMVFNATYIVPLNEMRESGFTREDYEFLSRDPDAEHRNSLTVVEDLGAFELAFDIFGGDIARMAPGLVARRPVSGPGLTRLRRGEFTSFYRFSAYSRDKRVTPNGLTSGTYATTYNDLLLVPSGLAAVGRYALPNPAAANHVYQVLTRTRPTLVGTTVSNHGQAGGGVEVKFARGARNEPGRGFVISAD